MKRIFVDIYLQFNLGDDLFLDILAKRFPDAQFTVNYLGNSYDDFLLKYDNVSRRKYNFINKIGQRLKITDSITNYDKVAEEHDALLFIGGSIFREEDYHHSLYQDRLKMVTEFKKIGKQVFILGANFGPYSSQNFYSDYERLFSLCDEVCFRDLYSYKLFNHISHVRYAPDIVFQMDLNNYKNHSKKKIVGFSIIDVRHKKGLEKYYEEYINSNVKSIQILIKKGYECCLMSFCEHEGDSNVIDKIIVKLSKQEKERVGKYEYKGNLEEAIKLIASFKLFLAARFHANILALLLNVPLLPIIYSEKTKNVLNDINFQGHIIEMKKLCYQYDEHLIKESMNTRVDLKDIRNNAKLQFDKFEEFIKEDNVIHQ
ncbi:polysaccharide pyruvyl transferase family protein [Bacillus alkalicellulosilyticus]|uniref:polysaccharide pyruvyl transferase family protein n=1 Tax=Alkalihalobacterium alkalicellulosilyticum TaxID=1912214 RepID=UPI0009975C88|nr:polysaccharide pyruvyl transferase family protein [Bacillus alkalicellulosilyticus]